MNKRFGSNWIFIPIIISIIVDIYVFQAIKTSFAGSKPNTRKIISILYVLISSFTYLAFLIAVIKGYTNWHGWSKNIIVGVAQAVFIGKLLILPFLLIDDSIRLFRWIFSFIGQTSISTITQPNGISRLQFLSRVGLILGSGTVGAFFYGIVRGAYNYKINRIKLNIPNLPDEFKHLKIVQISDMHLGSFADETPVRKIVDLINAEQADFVFFTGDLVNYAAKEAVPYISILKEIKASEKIFSILGNHDYGTYLEWNSEKEMHDNFNHLLSIQRKELGWDLLMDEHRIIEKNGKKLAIIGVQYIGHSLKFGKFGDLKKAHTGAENADVQLLLSHDPSHWDKEVSQLDAYKNIHATFAGHTHGFQFGIEIPKLNIQWSPSKYVYPHWAGLYTNKQQQLYVNRGAGFLGYPGRLGISPEISVFQFTKS